MFSFVLKGIRFRSVNAKMHLIRQKNTRRQRLGGVGILFILSRRLSRKHESAVAVYATNIRSRVNQEFRKVHLYQLAG